MSQGGHSDPTTSSDSDAIEIPSSNSNNGTLTNLEGGIAECCVKTDDENAMKLSNEAKSRSNSPPKELHALSPCLNLSLTTASLPSTSEDWSSTCKTTSENGEDNNIKSDSSNHSDGDNNVNNNNTDGNSNNIIPRKCVYSSAGKRKAALPRKRPALPEEPVQISAETGEVVEDECCDVMNCCSSDLMAATSSEIIPVAFDQTSCSKRLGITTSTGRKNRSSNYSQSYPKESSPSSSITPTDKAGINISSNFPLPSQSSTIDHYQTVDKSGDLDGSNSSLIMNNALTKRHASTKGIVNDNNSSNKYAMISTHDSSAATTAALLNGLCANNLPANIQDLLTTPSPATLNAALNQLILASASGVVDMSAFGTLNMSDLLSASAGSQGILPFLGANLADLNMDPQKMQLTLIEAATMAAANSAFCGLVGSANNLSGSELDQLNVCDAILKQQQSHHHKQTSSVSKCSSKQPHLSTSLSLLNNTSDNNKKYSNSISNTNNMIQLPSVIMSGTDPMNTLASINQKVNNNPSSLQIDSSNSDHRVSIGIPLPAVLPEVNGSSQNVNAESRESFLLRDSRLTISQKLLAAEEEAAAGNDTPKMTREDRIDLEELENFAQTFKKQRIKFGFTQGDVGMALGRRYGTDFSQTTISRFEALNLSFKNMCKLRPLLKEWLADAENAIANGATASDLLEAQKNPDLSGNQMNALSATNATVLTSSGSLLTSSSALVDSGSLSPNGTATTTTKSYGGGLGTCHLNSATSGLLAANSNALSSNNTAILTTATSIPLRKRRKRTNLDSAQRAALDGYFQINSRPDHERMAQIAQTLELDRDVVRVWFCNRRQKVRKE